MGKWIGHDSNFEPGNINQLWHGAKIREYQNFWNPVASWEGPQRCKTIGCKKWYRVFPESMQCTELRENFDVDKLMYSFPCTECGMLVEDERIWHKINRVLLHM